MLVAAMATFLEYGAEAGDSKETIYTSLIGPLELSVPLRLYQHRLFTLYVCMLINRACNYLNDNVDWTKWTYFIFRKLRKFEFIC